jgi:hypothetical protein
MFNKPIPGESLTSKPKNAPYENPPEITDPEEALQVHLARLTDTKRMDKIMGLLDIGVDIQTMTEGILRSAVMNGVHSIDVSLIIAPVIHEYIKLTADQVGIDYKEGFEDDEESESGVDYMLASIKSKEKLQEMDMIPEEVPQTEDQETTILEDEEEVKPMLKGLMVRGEE